jgi:hypothetical protein
MNIVQNSEKKGALNLTLNMQYEPAKPSKIHLKLSN